MSVNGYEQDEGDYQQDEGLVESSEGADRAAVDSAMEQGGQLPDKSSDNIEQETSDASEKPSEDWEAQYVAQQDRVLRLHAEMENLRNRTTRELSDQRKYGCLPLLKDILPVIDNIDRAIESAQQDESAQETSSSQDSSGLLEGFRLVRQQLLSILEQHHCVAIDALGQPFDPKLHEAILQQPSEDQPKDNVMLVTQAGYRLYDRVVQASKVIVSSGPLEG